MSEPDDQLEEMRGLRQDRMNKLARMEPTEVKLGECPECHNKTVVERNAGFYKFCLKCPWKEEK
jgi:ribosomal protein L37AE/L43A